ncbi:hypothetical protein IP91_01033 [Pseudoduganella lurida]|uniref:Uncharacterized protein n=1 Tax=Pseudoduganella lurida TaxID=1036180 RepID=A0A562RLN7_9BURK|nr:catalase family protein [Pseudoduganella lurida]TWI69955.1 hypothetical protein IP91_01033 [Pseudoduganella lurida]
MLPPIKYDPRYEVLEENEGDTEKELLETLRSIQDTTFKDSGQPLRSVHAKSHGLLRGELKVLDNLPHQLAQGLFAKEGTYPVLIRLSTSPGDVLEDAVSTPRGMAVKVLGVEGARLSGSEGDTTQDFVTVNGKAFMNPGPKSFLGGLKLLAGTTDKAPSLKKLLSAALRGAEKALEAVGTESAQIKGMGGEPAKHPLGESFFSQTPILFGDYMAKVSIAPVSVGLAGLKGEPVDLNDPNVLRHVVQQHFAQQGGEWELRVQLNTNIEEMPIEDASAEWPENVSPYIPVARITAPPQAGWSEALSLAIDEKTSFSPWHGLAAHRPLGALNRVRKAAYAMSSGLRAQHGGTPIVEPKTLDGIPF